jgi:hypothetical protein
MSDVEVGMLSWDSSWWLLHETSMVHLTLYTFSLNLLCHRKTSSCNASLLSNPFLACDHDFLLCPNHAAVIANLPKDTNQEHVGALIQKDE